MKEGAQVRMTLKTSGDVFTTNFSANINMSVAKVGVNFRYGDWLLH
jgi:hypothetical protein